MSYEHVKSLRQNQTKAERLLWIQLRAKRTGSMRFRRQHPIGPFIVDFYCHGQGSQSRSMVIRMIFKSNMMSVEQTG
ncbi:MAG: DUF559 domain-containing protein [Alphaproteobacteria bacterium]